MFKYVFQDETSTWQFGQYFARLRVVGTKIPEIIRDLIYNEERYVLNSPRSFHDAWLIALSIRGPHECEPSDVFTLDLTLLGPCHDRLFKLTYTKAVAYVIERKEDSGNLDSIKYKGSIKHKDDLLVHEFDVLEDSTIEHRILFYSGLFVYIKCAEIQFEEVMLEGATGSDQ